MKDGRKRLGHLTEALAAAFLRALGMDIRARNVRLRSGEIDIVARAGKTLVFVEVRSRSTDDGISPLDSIGNRKRKQLRRVVSDYLNQFGVGPERDIRIDVVGVTLQPGSAHIEHFRDAV